MGVYPRPMSLVTPMSGFRKGMLPTPYLTEKAEHRAAGRAQLVAHFPGFHSSVPHELGMVAQDCGPSSLEEKARGSRVLGSHATMAMASQFM